MPSPYDSPLASDAPVRGVAWVVRGFLAVVAIAAWLVLLVHVFLLARAEHRLDQVLRDSNRFAQLPEMSPAELSSYTQRRLAEQGFREGKISLDRVSRSVHQIEAKPAGGSLQLTGTVAGWFTTPTVLHSGGSGKPDFPILGR